MHSSLLPGNNKAIVYITCMQAIPGTLQARLLVGGDEISRENK